MRVIIIGSGISGLTAGALLAKAGCEVNIFEQNKDIGGVTCGFHKNGFRWDMGQLILEGLGPGEQAGKVIDELGLRERLKLTPADRVYSFPDFIIKPPAEYEGPWWREGFFSRLFPQEKKGISKYYRYYRRMMEIVTLARAAEGSRGAKALLNKAGMYARLLPLLPKAKWSAQQLMDFFFKDREIKAALTAILADFVVKPEEFQGLGVAFVNPEPAFDCRVPLKISRVGRQPSCNCIDGGCRALVDALAETIRTHNGKIHTGCEVTAVKTKDNKATGIELAGRKSHDADIVIASGGAKEIFGLLKPGLLNDEYQKIVDSVPLMESVFMIQAGLDIDPSQYLESGVNYFYRTYEVSGCIERLKNGVYHEGEDGFLICNPTLYSPKSAPEGRYAVTLYTVAPNSPGFDWASRKQEMAEKLLVMAEEKIPELRKHIVEIEIFTPEDFRKLTMQKHHSFGGCAPVMNKKAVPNRTPIEGFWFIGSQSESGAGINNVVEGAWRVCSIIISKH